MFEKEKATISGFHKANLAGFSFQYFHSLTPET
jgi:hypothetical protein